MSLAPSEKVLRIQPETGGLSFDRRARSGPGFALTELLVVIAILAVVFGIVLAAVARARTTARSVTCLNNLRQICQGLHSYATENGDKFPDPAALQTSWESVLKDYVAGNLTVFLCPSDTEIGPNTGSSYDWRDTGVPGTTLAGKSLFDISRGDAVLAFESLPGWHAKKKMNVGRIDGSCATIDGEDAIADLLRPIR